MASMMMRCVPRLELVRLCTAPVTAKLSQELNDSSEPLRVMGDDLPEL